MSIIMADVAIGAGARTLWQEELLLDYAIEVEDEQFKVHKVVMASVSDYFRAMLTGGMVESQTDRVRLERFSSVAVSGVINFIYTNQLGERSVTSLKALLDCSVYLQIPTAIERCTVALCEKVDKNNCLNILSVFKSYSLEKGIVYTVQYMKANRKEILMACQYVKLSFQDTLSLMDCYRWSEWGLFSFVNTWIHADYEDRKQYVNDLMTYIQFSRMPATQLAHIKKMDIFSESDGQWRDLVQMALSSQEISAHKKIMGVAGKNNDLSDPILVCFDKVSRDVDEENPKYLYALSNENTWQKYKAMKPDFEIDPEAAVIVNNFIICYENYKFKWRIFDCQTLTWSIMTSNNYHPHREAFALVYHDQHLYIMGGQTDGPGELPDTIQRYSFETNKWQVISSRLPMPLLGPSAFSISGAIYMLGGWQSHKANRCMSRLDCFHPSSGAWESKAPMLVTSCANRIQLLELSETVITVLDSSFNLQCYKPSTDQWSVWRNVSTGLSHLRWSKEARPVSRGNSLIMFNYGHILTDRACEKWTIGENGLVKVDKLPDVPPDVNPSISVFLSI